MSKTVLSIDLARALLKAMGCPLALCTQVQLNVEMGAMASVILTYHLDPAWLESAGEELSAKKP